MSPIRRGCLQCRVDDGAGSVLILTAVAVVVLVGTAVLVLLGGLADRQRVQLAADLAAFAAAQRVVWDADPCATSVRVAHAHRASISECTVDGAGLVTVVTELDGRGALRPVVHGVARAGPGDVDVSAVSGSS
jgi:secretion/DNA translocation related TadE-like protein